ncbi:MAG: universal stress protein [Bacteroidetes bacterium]|nr:universal stress protein [Bacteroidota bacterium]
MKTILIPTDYSPAAMNAADYALDFAKHIDAQVILLHVFHIPIVTTEVPIAMPTFDELEKYNLDTLKQWKQELRIRHKSGTISECIVKPGFVIDEIRNTVKEKSIDLIVMGITGSNKLAELLIGSNTTGVIKDVKCHTLIIPEGAVFRPIKIIAFACDFEKFKDETALNQLKAFVLQLNAKLMILNVVDSVEETVTTEKALSGIRIENIFENVNHSLHFPEDDDVVHAINKFVDFYEADQIVMIPHKHNMFSRMFHEGSTKKMAFHTHVPLLAIPE